MEPPQTFSSCCERTLQTLLSLRCCGSRRFGTVEPPRMSPVKVYLEKVWVIQAGLAEIVRGGSDYTEQSLTITVGNKVCRVLLH